MGMQGKKMGEGQLFQGEPTFVRSGLKKVTQQRQDEI